MFFKIVQNAGDIPKDIIVEQLLITKTEPGLDDIDPMWEDISVEYKMVIVINKGLNMSVGKTASQVTEYNNNIRIINNNVNNTKIKFK